MTLTVIYQSKFQHEKQEVQVMELSKMWEGAELSTTRTVII
jgi:hypothetical protein